MKRGEVEQAIILMINELIKDNLKHLYNKIIVCLRIFITCVVWIMYHVQRLKKRQEKFVDGEMSFTKILDFLFLISKLGLILGYIYLCDRTDLFPKESK